MQTHDRSHPISLWRRVALACAVAAWCWLAASLGGMRPASAAPGAQVVNPEDISTPTPVYEIILQPTPTPTATSTAPKFAPAHAPDEAVYTVKPGDTLFRVALEIGVDVVSVPCAVGPMFDPEQPLVIGDAVAAPPPGWQCHAVLDGDTLASIADLYGVSPTALRAVAWNQLPPTLGDYAPLPTNYVRVPTAQAGDGGGGFLTYMLNQPVGLSPIIALGTGGPRQAKREVVGPIPKDWPYGSGNFTWPVYGWLSQGYRFDHPAVDIAAPPDTFVTAADRGVVIRAGWNDQGYGLFVVIDHNIDYVTLYAHLDEVYVEEGDVVAQGQILGTVGSSGNSTGPHLHFEIRDFGRRANPLELLMR